MTLYLFFADENFGVKVSRFWLFSNYETISLSGK